MNAEHNQVSRNSGIRLKNFHITFYAIVLGMAGFALAVQKLAGMEGTGIVPSLAGVATILVYVALALFGLVTLVYGAKAIRHPAAVGAELRHPIKISFFPLVAKISLVLSIIFLERSLPISKGFWIAGTTLQLVASLLIISSWMHHTHYKIDHLTPAWYVPVVGALMVPIVGTVHGFVEISWFFFAIGIAFWGVLFAVVIYRMIFHPPIPSRLLPTLFILFAPPAIAFIAYSKLASLASPDGFARVLYYLSCFLLALVVVRPWVFARLRFALSWWAYSFPLAAHSLATLRMLHLTHAGLYRIIASVEVAALAVLICVLLLVTGRAIARREICVEE